LPDAWLFLPALVSKDGWMTRNVSVVVLAALALAGCRHQVGGLEPYLNDSARDRGLVIVLPGIEGRSAFNEAICEGLVDGGVTWAIDLADWTASMPMSYLVNLRDEGRNRIKAQDIADSIVRYRMAYPNTPVVLVGQSSGGGMAIWVAEAMPPTERIEGIITLAPSLSPEYSLDSALLRTRRGIVNFYSERDWVILGVGTTLSGTMDGSHTSSAGRVGFEPPWGGPSLELYERKLFQIPWQPGMADAGHRGMHLTSGARLFVAAYVAPLVLAKTWDPPTLQAITSGEPPVPTGRPASRPSTVALSTSARALGPATRPAGGTFSRPVTPSRPAAR
jgi:pimeloyl-ACP methyl ester carboxylesterase